MISVIVPAYNAEATLPRTLDSLLAQTDRRWEAVIVNDGSFDATLEIAIDYAQRDKRFKIVHQENGGTASALNAGVQASTEAFITHLDADDELLPHFIERSLQAMVRFPDFDIYASNALYCTPGGKESLFNQGERFAQVTSLSLVDEIEAPQIFGTAAFRRTYFDQVGGFRPSIYNEDYDFWLRIIAAGARHIYQPEPLAIYHASPDQKTSNVLRARRCDLVIMCDLAAVEGLSPAEYGTIKARITELKRNIRIRWVLYKLLGQQRAERMVRRQRDQAEGT